MPRPGQFVEVLTDAGYLAALIPKKFGGAGRPLRAAAVVLEEIHSIGCNAGTGHAQVYIVGTLLRHGNEQQKRDYLPRITTGELRLQAFGVTEPTSGSDTTKLKTRGPRWRPLRDPRPEGPDIACAVLRRDASPRALATATGVAVAMFSVWVLGVIANALAPKLRSQLRPECCVLDPRLRQNAVSVGQDLSTTPEFAAVSLIASA